MKHDSPSLIAQFLTAASEAEFHLYITVSLVCARVHSICPRANHQPPKNITALYSQAYTAGIYLYQLPLSITHTHVHIQHLYILAVK